MRMLLQISFAHEKFNDYVLDGSIGKKMHAILGEIKPEAAYFTEMDGKRTALLIVDMTETSQMPALAEPFFVQFNADVRWHPVMLPADLERAGLEQLGKRWS